MTDLFFRTQTFRMQISSWRKNCFCWRWLARKVCFKCSVTAETCAANQFQLLGHDNCSKQMCLLVVKKNAYEHFYLILSESICLFRKHLSLFRAMCTGKNLSEVCKQLMLRTCSVDHVLSVNSLCKRSEPRGTLSYRFNWHWEFLKVGQSLSPITQCFLYVGK